MAQLEVSTGREDEDEEAFDGATEGAPNRVQNRRKLGAALACLLVTAIAIVAIVSTNDMRMLNRNIAESDTLALILWLVSAQNRATVRHSKEFFESQRELVKASARNFELLEYWRDMRVTSKTTDWYPMISLRFDMMLRQWTADPRADDFRVEKDKCEMYNFVERNRLPVMSILKRWEGEPAGCPEGERCPALAAHNMYTDLQDMSSTMKYPTFLKCCHLTQGFASSTLGLWEPSSVVGNGESILNWVAEKWTMRADDWERPWRVNHNILTDTLKPGMLMRAGWKTSYDDYRKRQNIIELKVHVVWGRALLAGYHDFLFFRDGKIDSYIGASTTWHAATDSTYLKWIRDEGHLNRTFAFAEGVALLMGIDCVRVDFFIEQGNMKFVMNENSLSSARSPLFAHTFKYMSALWAEGHTDKWYKNVFKTTKRSYEISMHDPPYPNRARVD